MGPRRGPWKSTVARIAGSTGRTRWRRLRCGSSDAVSWARSRSLASAESPSETLPVQVAVGEAFGEEEALGPARLRGRPRGDQERLAAAVLVLDPRAAARPRDVRAVEPFCDDRLEAALRRPGEHGVRLADEVASGRALELESASSSRCPS
jgi:hypothetical protein